MIAYLANLLGFSKAPDPQYSAEGKRIPVAGERCWRLDNSDGSPFPEKKRYKPVEIIDVRDGWVRFKIGSVFLDERMKIEEFISMYYADEVPD